MKDNLLRSAKVLRVIDGDTISVSAQMASHKSRSFLVNEYLRLARIDAPELHDSDAGKKLRATAAKVELAKLLDGTEISFFVTDEDKYGRLVAEVYCFGLNVSDWLVYHKLADYRTYK